MVTKQPTTPKDPRPNLTPLSHGYYIVRTQAGFRTLQKAWHLMHSLRSFTGFPTYYPVVCSLDTVYRGGGYSDGTLVCQKLEFVHDKTKQILDELERHMATAPSSASSF